MAEISQIDSSNTVGDGATCPSIWLPDIVQCIAGFLTPNDVALTLRQLRWNNPEAFRGYTRPQRIKLLALTAATGSIENLEVALNNIGLNPSYELFEAAAGAGQLHVCKLLRRRNCPWGNALAAAAKAGHRHVCEWTVAEGGPLYMEAVCSAAQAVGTAGKPPPPPLVLSQGQRGAVLAAAACSLTSDWEAKVKWLEQEGYPRTAAACKSAVSIKDKHGALDRLKWLCSRGYPVDACAWDRAMAKGNTAAVRFLVVEKNVRPSEGREESIMCAAYQGRLSVLRYLHESRCSRLYPQMLSKYAANGGQLSVVAWTVDELGVDQGKAPDLLDLAAESGNVELLSWLHERGWTWSRDVWSSAAFSGCEEVLEWLIARGCPLPRNGGPAYLRAVHVNDLAMLRCLRRLGISWGGARTVAGIPKPFSLPGFSSCVSQINQEIPTLQAAAVQSYGEGTRVTRHVTEAKSICCRVAGSKWGLAVGAALQSPATQLLVNHV
ncbi:hypothetical protein VOLCADRAFT_104992 [Volvox carteri f. nagariensis]|uniref:Uncharacterized protein n=1 Tax=Volvox carteri f. nagariensis TaxID=3068 RepID=D8TXN4_VOLCA|nr:uncharacterized protein VOLCADRAFT_104992 [Volvox carteri f. nagariensis]EFJ47755.1 hypothetical protein VOLCADRAFT_104992 [Volvox carteri f. nagariensis]|eukprot:XP_002951226.1 hypothetical protein VOLCADRAFT_104992 [Volvox carteri f. nagariensis]